MTKISRQKFTTKDNPAYCKVGEADSKVSRANAQSRPSGILFASANGKLYFEFLKIFSVPENTCPCREQNASEVSIFQLRVESY